MLRWRLLSAGIILGLFLALIALDFRQTLGAPPGAWLLGSLVLIVVLGVEEMLSLLAHGKWRPVAWPVYLGAVGITLAFGWPMWSPLLGFLPTRFEGNAISLPLWALTVAILLIAAVEVRRFTAPGNHLVHIALAVFTLVYIAILGGYLAALRLVGAENGTGIVALVSMLVVVKSSDVGAYAFGRLLGSTKLTPQLSAGKTVEGAIGGVATACFASWLFFRLIVPALNLSASSTLPTPSWSSLMLYGLILAAAGILGDLVESLIKRDMQRKDSSTWLLGLGGVLDIIDSLLFGAPAAYFCWELGLLSW